MTGSHTLTNLDFRATTSIAAGTTLTATGSVTLTAGALNGTGTLAAQGAVSQASAYTGGAATLLLNGAGAQTFTGAATTAAGDLPLLVINKPSGTLTLAGTIRTTHNWTYTAGTVDPGISLVVFAGGTITGSHALNALDFRATTTIAAGTTLTAVGNVSLNAGSLNGTGTLAAQGDVAEAAVYPGGTATLLVGGPGAQTLTGAATAAAGDLPLLVINKPSGTLTLAGTIRTTKAWTYTAGTVDPGASLVVFAGTQTISGSHALNDVTFNGVGVNYTVAAGTVLTVGGALTLTDGNILTGTIAAKGSIAQASTFDGNTGTLLINGAGAQTFTGAATTAAGSLPNVDINKPSGTLTLAGTIRTTHNWTYSGGTVDPGSSLVVFAGGTVIGSHTLNAVDFRATTSIAAGDDPERSRQCRTDRRRPQQHRDAGGPGGRQPGLDLHRRHGDPALQRARGAGLHRDGHGRRGRPARPRDQQAGRHAHPDRNDPDDPQLDVRRRHGRRGHLARRVRRRHGHVGGHGLLRRDIGHRHGDPRFRGRRRPQPVGDERHVHHLGLELRALDRRRPRDRRHVPAEWQRRRPARQPHDDRLDRRLATSTIQLVGPGGQTISGSVTTTPFNLVVNDPAGVTIASNVTIAGTLTLTNGQLTIGPALLSISRPIAGTLSNLVSGPTSSIAVTGALAGIALPATVAQLNNLTLNDVSGLTLQGDVAVGGTLNLTNGPLLAIPNTVTITPTGTVVRTTGRVVGMLQKHVVAGAGGTVAFEIGDATTYAPVTVVFGTVTTPGELVASTTPGEHPDVANAGIAVARDVNRYWTLSNVGVAFDTAATTFTFVAGDIDAGAQTATFVVADRVGGIWSRPPAGARTAVSTQATGVTAFGDFVVGEPTSDLAVTVTDGLASVIAGDGLSHGYLITVTNNGPSDATAAAITDAWPAGFSQGLIVPSQGSCAPLGPGPAFSCALGTIAAGASATVSVAYTVPPATLPGVQTDSVSVSSAVVDPTPANDVGADSTTVTDVASLTTSTDDGQVSVVAGTGGYGYTITVTNSGPSDTHGVVLDDLVPAAFTAGPPSADLGGDCSGSAGNTIHCTLPGALAPGATWTISVPYAVAAGVPAQTVTNIAGAVSVEDPSGSIDPDATDVTTSADLAVTVTDGLASVIAGDGLSHGYLITVTNNGPSDATAAAITDAWPAGFSQGLIVPSQGSCAPVGPGPDFSCALGTIPAGASATVSVAYTVPAATLPGVQTDTRHRVERRRRPDPRQRRRRRQHDGDERRQPDHLDR